MTREHLIAGHDFGTPVNEMIFRRRPKGAHPEHTFEGRLELLGEAIRGRLEVIQDDYNLRDATTPHLPELDFEFVQHGSHLIPVRRGLIITEHPQWNYFLEPGRVWKENADGGLSRASFPFALVWKNQACTHNGVMSFLFDDVNISHVWYQITQETCLYFKGNFWGMLAAAYHPGPLAGADRIRRQYVREIQEKFPRAPLARLASDYPGVDVSQFGRQVAPAHLTSYGVVMEGVVYTAPCRTRFGESAYCERMRFPSYSTAKSAYAGVTLMRLAQRYGAWVVELRIADYVEETAAGAGDWSVVTLGDALDMATGNYVDPGAFVDENYNLGAFFNARTYADKMWQALRAPHQDPPGARWVYRSTDTFVAGRAMSNFLRTEEGQELDLFKWMVREVYRPLRTGPGFYTTLRTSDNNWRGLPFTYMGLFWTHDDVAKVVTFLNVDRGAIDGEQLLHPELFAAAMQETPASLGLEAGSSGLVHYRYGFYAREWTSGPAVAVHGPFHVQYMLGYGGILIVMMPNGSAYYYFSDNDDYAISAAVEESMLHLRPRKQTANAGSAGAVPGPDRGRRPPGPGLRPDGAVAGRGRPPGQRSHPTLRGTQTAPPRTARCHHRSAAGASRPTPQRGNHGGLNRQTAPRIGLGAPTARPTPRPKAPTTTWDNPGCLSPHKPKTVSGIFSVGLLVKNARLPAQAAGRRCSVIAAIAAAAGAR